MTGVQDSMAEANPNLVAIIAAIPPTLTAAAAFALTLRNGHRSQIQHQALTQDIDHNKEILIAHAARMGTVGRRATDNTAPVPGVPELSRSTGSEGVSERESRIYASGRKRPRKKVPGGA